MFCIKTNLYFWLIDHFIVGELGLVFSCRAGDIFSDAVLCLQNWVHLSKAELSKMHSGFTALTGKGSSHKQTILQ